MANKIKINTGIDQGALNLGKWSIGVSGSGMGPSGSTGFKNGITPPAGGYVIYFDESVRVAHSDSELIEMINLFGGEVTTVQGALLYAKNVGILVLNHTLEDISTDGLVSYMDAKHVSSWPRDGKVWYSMNGETKDLSQLKVLGFYENIGVASMYNHFANNSIMTTTTETDILNIDPVSAANTYDLVVADSAVWSFGSNVMQKLKDFVDAGLSVIAVGNDNRTNVFVQEFGYGADYYRAAHDIIMEDESLIGFGGHTFTYGSTDAYGGIKVLRNGAKPLYRRSDSGLIMGFVYHNEELGSSLFFDQEYIGTFGNDIYQAALSYIIKNIGFSGKFVNTPIFEDSTGSFKFDEANEYFDISETAVENLSEDFTLIGICRQGATGAPHQTVIGTATGYRNGAKLMSRYHGAAAFWVGNNDGTDSYLLSSNVNITDDGKWHHLAATRNSATGELKIYIDGVLKNNANYVTGPLSMEGPATIGVDYHSSAYNHTGNIASVKAYNRVLSEDEIKRDAYNGQIVTSGLSFAMDPADIRTWGTNGPGTSGTLRTIDHGLNIYANQHTHIYSKENGGTFRMGQLNDGTLYRSTYLQPNDGQYTTGPFSFSSDDGYTVSIWVKRTQFGEWATSNGGHYDGIWNYYWNHNLYFSGANTGYNAIQGTGFSTPYTIEMDRWYHVTSSHNNLTNQHRIYIDGELIHENYFGSASPNADGTNRRFYIGNWDSGWSMVGNIGTCQIYNRAITQEEVLQNYQAHKLRYE